MHTAAEIAEQYTADLEGLGELIEDLATIYGQAGGDLYVGVVRHRRISGLTTTESLDVVGLYTDARTASVDTDAYIAEYHPEHVAVDHVGDFAPVTPRPVPSDVMQAHEVDRLTG